MSNRGGTMGDWWDDEDEDEDGGDAETSTADGGVLGPIAVLGGLGLLAAALGRLRREEGRAQVLAAQTNERRRRQERRDAAIGSALGAHRFLSSRRHRYQAVVAGLCAAIGAIFLAVFFASDTRVTEDGHLWWKERTVTQVSVSDRMGVLLFACAFLLAAACLTFFAVRGVLRFESNAGALAQAKAAQQKRARARAIAARDPHLAHELRIGRPDLAHPYDDGGLVDVNSAPSSVLTARLGLSIKEAAGVVATRRHLGGFSGAEELVTLAEVEPATYDRASHLIILL